MKPTIFKLTSYLLLAAILYGFHTANERNYAVSLNIKRNIVDHPESLPTKQVAKNTALWFTNMRADLYWLQAVQYIWGNAIWSEYKKYLYSMLDIITELNPYFEHPYIIGQLLLPSYNPRYEKINEDKQENHTAQWIRIGKKGMANFCDEGKLQLIKEEFNIQTLSTESRYKNPCKSYKIPYNLGFMYYHYLKDPILSSYYYRVTSAQEDSPEWAKVMAAIMQGKWWWREKSFFMFTDMAVNISSEETACSTFADSLRKWALTWKLPINAQTIKAVQETREKIFWDEMQDWTKVLDETACPNFLWKAIRELNLTYIEWADKEFFKKFNRHSYNAKELLDNWYIDFLPTDPQRNADQDGFEIIYKYNEETKNYDYELGKYE